MQINLADNHIPRIMVVSESSAQRLAFGQAIKSIGYHLVDCIPSEKLATIKRNNIDLWLIDSNDDVSVINQLTLSDNYLLGFTSAPNITDIKAFDKWQRHLKRKLLQIFGEDVTSNQIIDAEPIFKIRKRSWHVVIVIGASMGGPAAVKNYLDHLPADLPIAIVMAQHSDETAIKTLPRILTMHNEWQCEVVTGNAQIAAGKVWLLPPEQAVTFHTSGWLLPAKHGWEDQYKPSISQTMISASSVFAKKVIHIVFSGMGNDGVSATETVRAQGGEIWVQAPATCECDSQTSAMIATNSHKFIGSPVDLAKHTTLYVQRLAGEREKKMSYANKLQ